MSLFTIDSIGLLFLIHSCTALNTYDITYEPNGETRWTSTTPFVPSTATSYGQIRLGQVMSIEFDFKYEGRSSSFISQFFRIGAPATTTGCYAQESKYPSMWLKYGTGAILDIQFSGDVSCTTKNYLSGYGNLNLNADHHIIITLNNKNISITITGGGVGKTDPYTQSWPRDPTPVNLLGTNVFVWWAGDKSSGDYDVALGTFSNIIIISMPPTTTVNPTLTPTHNPTSLTNTPTTFTASPSRQPTNSPTYTPPMPSSNTKQNNDKDTGSDTITVLFIIIGLLSVIIVVGCILFFIHRNKGKSMFVEKQRPVEVGIELNSCTSPDDDDIVAEINVMHTDNGEKSDKIVLEGYGENAHCYDHNIDNIQSQNVLTANDNDLVSFVNTIKDAGKTTDGYVGDKNKEKHMDLDAVLSVATIQSAEVMNIAIKKRNKEEMENEGFNNDGIFVDNNNQTNQTCN